MTDAPWKVAELDGYTARYRLVNEVVCDFELYEVAGTLSDGTRVYGDAFEPGLESAARFANGHVKWDGCSNVMFDDCADNCMLHFCGRSGVTALATALDRCYDLAREAIGAERCFYE